MNDPEPKSPCISICLLDKGDICTGCFRSAAEITDWFMASAVQKRETLRRARERREGSTVIRLS
jgi:predicted Fe-S protein YdhL (DUF1289 family)